MIGPGCKTQAIALPNDWSTTHSEAAVDKVLMDGMVIECRVGVPCRAPFKQEFVLVRAVDLDFREVSIVYVFVEITLHHPQPFAMGHDACRPPQQTVLFGDVHAPQEFVFSGHPREGQTSDLPVPFCLDDMLDISLALASLAAQALLVRDIPSFETWPSALRSGLIGCRPCLVSRHVAQPASSSSAGVMPTSR